MKRATIFFTTMLFLLIFAHSAKAALQDLGGGLIYDDDSGITWMQNANYAGTMTWDEAVAWADNLFFHGYNDWRLPDTDTSCSGKGCTGSDMGHLYTDEGISSNSPGLFTDVKPNIYWSARSEERRVGKEGRSRWSPYP